MGDLEKFTEFLYGNRSGYVYVPVKKKDQSWHKNFFNWPLQKTSMYDFIRTASLEDDVYISPALFKEKSGQKTAFKSTGVVWVEFDGKADIDFKGLPEPDCIVQSSTAANLHCYWRTESLGSEAVEDINRRLTYFLGADSSGWDANQVLRPPETNNWKSQIGKPVKLQKLIETVHDVSDFDKAPAVPALKQVTVYDDLIPQDKLKIPDVLQARVFKEIAIEPGRSAFLMNTGYLLAEAGLSQIEIVSALYIVDCRIMKFVGRSDQLVRLSEIASIAAIKSAPEESSSYSPLEIVNHELNLDWYIEGWLHSTGLMILTGAPGVGKTQFALNMGYLLAASESVLGKPLTPPKKVAVISLEMDVVELKYIFSLQAKAYTDLTAWDQNLRVFTYEEGSLPVFEKDLTEYGPDVVIIDSLSELATDDLQEAEARKIMRWLKKIRKQIGFGIIIIHHNRKAQDTNKKPKKLSDLYGSFIFAKLSETVVSLWQDEDSELLELNTLKTRFGKSETIRLKRTEHLTFEVNDVDISINGNPLIPKLGFGSNDES